MLVSLGPLARGKAFPEHLPRRGDEHGHDIGVTLARGGNDGARHVADHCAAGFDIEIDGEGYSVHVAVARSTRSRTRYWPPPARRLMAA
jgi:hypothetical protein